MRWQPSWIVFCFNIQYIVISDIYHNDNFKDGALMVVNLGDLYGRIQRGKSSSKCRWRFCTILDIKENEPKDAEAVHFRKYMDKVISYKWMKFGIYFISRATLFCFRKVLRGRRMP